MSISQPFGRMAYDVDHGSGSPASYENDGLPPVKGARINTSRGTMIVVEVVKPAGRFGQRGLIRAVPAPPDEASEA